MTTFDVAIVLTVPSGTLDITRIDDDTRLLGSVTIERGSEDEQTELIPTTVTFQMLDNNCVLDGDNYRSPYYGLIGLGTEMFVRVDGETRARVEISKMDYEPGETPDINYLNIEGKGFSQRLSDGKKPVKSVAYSALGSPDNESDRIFYAPLEEDTGATMVSVFDGEGSVTVSGEVNFGADTNSKSSDRLAVMGTDGQLIASIPTYTSTEHKVCFLFRMASALPHNGASIQLLVCEGGNIEKINVKVNTPWTISFDIIRGGVGIDNSNSFDATNWFDSEHEVFVSLEFTQSGSNVSSRLLLVDLDTGDTQIVDDTLVGVTIGRIKLAQIGSDVAAIPGCSYGQWIVGDSITAFANYISPSGFMSVLGTQGYEGEPAVERRLRILDEAGIDYDEYLNASAYSELMGPQESGTVWELVNSTVEADMSLVYESRTNDKFISFIRVDLYNQVPAASLTIEHLMPGFKPVIDNLRVVNDVEMSREGGGKARYVIPDGDRYHYSTEEPPDGARQRESAARALLFSDDQLLTQAAWRAHRASWREKRFPSITMELAKPVFTSDDRAAVRDLDIGRVLVIDTTDAPAYVPYNEIREIVRGYTEVVSKFSHYFTFNTTPADIYEVSYVDFSDGTELANVIDSDDSQLKIQPGVGPPPSTDSLDTPYHISVDGDPMTVTFISTDTPAFIAAGATSFADAASVSPALPAGITADVGQLLVVVAGTRPTLASALIGTVPAGWTTLFTVNSQIRVFAKYYVSGDSAPTVTFTGAAAGDTTFARMFAFSGLSMVLDKNIPAGYSDGYTTSLNGSAQNIAYPAYLNRRTNSAMLLIGIKNDDWTSVATVGGTTEICDASSTTGNDVGVVVDLYNPGTPTAIAAGSFTVTGGASATSYGIVAGLRPLQTANVTRDIAGPGVAHNPGAVIRGWRMGVNAL